MRETEMLSPNLGQSQNNSLNKTGEPVAPATGVAPEAGLLLEDPYIECLFCGTCCTRYQPNLSLSEARRVADTMGLDWEAFRESYTDPRWPATNSFLLRHENGACVFLVRDPVTERSTCRIHAFKPNSCLEWLASVFKPECQAGLKRWNLVVIDTGEVRGSAKSIERFSASQQSQFTGDSNANL
jgi:Fe-S-cluster containining protein